MYITKAPSRRSEDVYYVVGLFCITFQINYRLTSPLRAPLWITPPHFSANLPYPSHTLLPDPTTPTPPLLSLQSECHQYGYLGSLFILPIATSKKVSSFSHDIFLRGWDINPSWTPNLEDQVQYGLSPKTCPARLNPPGTEVPTGIAYKLPNHIKAKH